MLDLAQMEVPTRAQTGICEKRSQQGLCSAALQTSLQGDYIHGCQLREDAHAYNSSELKPKGKRFIGGEKIVAKVNQTCVE